MAGAKRAAAKAAAKSGTAAATADGGRSDAAKKSPADRKVWEYIRKNGLQDKAKKA